MTPLPDEDVAALQAAHPDTEHPVWHDTRCDDGPGPCLIQRVLAERTELRTQLARCRDERRAAQATWEALDTEAEELRQKLADAERQLEYAKEWNESGVAALLKYGRLFADAYDRMDAAESQLSALRQVVTEWDKTADLPFSTRRLLDELLAALPERP